MTYYSIYVPKLGLVLIDHIKIIKNGTTKCEAFLDIGYFDDCHTPIFDLTCHWHVSLGPTFIRRLTSISLRFSMKNSVERYFKIPHIWFRVGSSSLFILFLIYFIFNTIFYFVINFNFYLFLISHYFFSLSFISILVFISFVCYFILSK